MKHTFWLACFSALVISKAMAGGYQVALQGQRQIGMAHTGTALAYDASSIFFNPGSLSFTKQNNITIGGSLIRSRVRYLAPQETNAPNNYSTMTESPLGTPFTFYASWGPKESNLKFGLGIYTPFGSSVKWADDWKGYSVLQELKLQSIFFQPTVSYKWGKLGIGAGFVYSIGSVELRKGIGALATADGYASANLKGDASGMGYNVGLHYQATDDLSIGLNYRSQVDMKVSGGDANFNVPASAIAIGKFPVGGKTTFDATLPLPATASIGVGYKVNEKLMLALDYNFVFWSAYKELKFDYKDEVNGSKSTASPRKYKDASIIRVGAEYMATSSLAIRAGYYFDQTPVEDGYMTPETPDANRNCFTLGLGYKFSDSFSADASFLFIEGIEREQKQSDIDKNSDANVANGGTPSNDSFLAGTYKLRVLIPGLSLSYKF